jgi:uncharacterized membrane protein YqjE
VNVPESGLRIGDAERAAAADRLAWHFSHGRLDQAELDERLAQAMQATTAADLTELFADLPADEPVAAAATGGQPRLAAGRRHPARARRRPWLTVVVLAVCVVAAISVVHALAHSIVVLAVIGLIAAAWLRRRSVRERNSPPSTR